MAELRPMRWARPDDARRIADYHNACWHEAFAPLVDDQVMAAIEPRYERWERWLSDDTEHTTIVAIDTDDQPIGHMTIVGPELVHLFVDPAHHRKGLGRDLLKTAERLLGRNGHRQIHLHTIVGNTPAIALYESMGWTLTEETSVEELPNGSSYREHVMRKDLDDLTHVEANRQTWDDDAPNWVDRGRRSWAAEPHWGEMSVPDTEVGVYTDLEGADVVELGCGTGYVSAWCLAAGAQSAVGVDNSLAQLRSAQLLQQEFDRPFPLIWGNAEHVPLADGCCDLVINEYGAAMWCDPYAWIPEAARLLRPGGRLAFLTWSTLMAMSVADFEHEETTPELIRPLRNLHSVTFPDFDGAEFALSHGDWIAVLRSNGFAVDRLVELYAPEQGGPDRYSYYDASWAQRWPAEEIWVATKTG